MKGGPVFFLHEYRNLFRCRHEEDQAIPRHAHEKFRRHRLGSEPCHGCMRIG